MAEPLLRIVGLTTQLGSAAKPLQVVDAVNLTIYPGETFALLGESGCGKSMTALSLMQLLPPSGRVVGGEVLLDGSGDLLKLSEQQMRSIRGGRMAMIFQEPQTSLNPVMSIGRQITEAVELHDDHGRKANKARVVELLQAVGIPDPERRVKEYPHQMSGGMKQRVMIAMALAGRPQLLIADEPTTALDVTIQAQVLRLLKTLQTQMNMAVLLITHDLGVVAETADRLAVMYAGQIVEMATRGQFFRAPAHPYSRKLFAALPTANKRGQVLATIPGMVPSLGSDFSGCRFVDRCGEALAICREQIPEIYTAVERTVRCHLWSHGQQANQEMWGVPPHPCPPPRSNNDQVSTSITGQVTAEVSILEVRSLCVHFPIRSGILQRTIGHVRAVDGVSLTLKAGRTVALVGESGCGKTTVGKAILQLIRPTAGSVYFANQELTQLRAEQLRPLRRALQIIFQDPLASMNPRMSVGNIVIEGLIAQRLGANHAEHLATARKLLEQVGIPGDAVERYPHEFSGGQRQRICIARTLALKPRLIICDEPTSALDVSVQAQILNLLRDLQVNLQLSYLFITHNIAVVAYLAHEVAVMYLGRVVEQGLTHEILQHPLHPYTKALLSAVPSIDDGERSKPVRLEGDLPSPATPPQGCHFHPRCPEASVACSIGYPGAIAASATHSVHCLRVKI